MRVRRLKAITLAAMLVLALLAISGNIATSVARGPEDAPVISPSYEVAPETTYQPPDDRTLTPDGTAPSPISIHAIREAPWVSSPLSAPVKDAPIENFGVVGRGILYRSAQPDEAGYRWLVSQGVKSIVGLRREAGDNRSYVLSQGFRNYLWLNIEDETNPTDDQAEQFLAFVTDPQNWPVLIHCKVGLGRTGTMAALVRYAIDGWSMDEAIKEAKVYRGGVDLVPSQTEWLNRWATVHPPACHRPLPT